MTAHLAALDTRLFLWVNGHHLPWLDPVMVRLSYPGPLWLPLLLLVGFRLWRGDARERAVWVGLMVAVAASDHLCAQLLKPFFHRLRPYLLVEGTRLYTHHHGWVVMTAEEMARRGLSFAFPSCHSMNSWTAAAYLLALFGARAWPAAAAALGVAYSRVYLGYHYPGDVMGGMIFGTAWGWAVALLLQRALLPHLPKGPRRTDR